MGRHLYGGNTLVLKSFHDYQRLKVLNLTHRLRKTPEWRRVTFERYLLMFLMGKERLRATSQRKTSRRMPVLPPILFTQISHTRQSLAHLLPSTCWIHQWDIIEKMIVSFSSSQSQVWCADQVYSTSSSSSYSCEFRLVKPTSWHLPDAYRFHQLLDILCLSIHRYPTTSLLYHTCIKCCNVLKKCSLKPQHWG